MFSYFSQVKAKGKKFLFAALVLVLLAVFMGCKTESDPEDDLNYFGSLSSDFIGEWDSFYEGVKVDGYIIAGTDEPGTIIYDDGGFGFGYEGVIMFVSNYDNKSGVIIIKYTDSTKKTKTNPYHAIYYRDYIPGTSVDLANTWDATREDYDADTTTLSEAVKRFTRGTMGNWMDLATHTIYEKQP